MRGYYDVFPAKIETELRTAIISGGYANDRLPNGVYAFFEFFCTDLDCDCQRVLIKVFHEVSGHRRLEEDATISYSWNPHGDLPWSPITEGFPNPFLDPFHRQAAYADELMDFWGTMFERDGVYAARIRRHYNEIRAEVGQPGEPRRPACERPTPKLTRNDRKARRRRLARVHNRR